MKDKVKRRRIVQERKRKIGFQQKTVNENKLKEEEIEANRQRQEFEQRKIDFEELQIFKKKIELAKEKNKEMDQKFKQKRSEYASKAEFNEALKQNKEKRQLVIDKLEAEYEEKKQNYKFKWELGDFKFKRWFFGMGKEFSRISWSSKKSVWQGFIIVVSIVIFLALIFLAIDAIFSVGLFN